MTPNLNLPLIAASQSQKHVTANEQALGLDALCQLSVIDIADSPASAGDGDCYIVGASPSGPFAGAKPDNVAAHYNGVWTFYPPGEGWIAYVQDEQKFRAYNGAWVLLSALI